jgi:hypothetical protein
MPPRSAASQRRVRNTLALHVKQVRGSQFADAGIVDVIEK